MSPKIAIVTMTIGKDYGRAMEPGFQSKRDYAKRWGYDCIIGGEEHWIRDRPIPWSKIPFFSSLLDSYDWIWFSDADSMITNPDIKLEDLFAKVFDGQEKKHAAWWQDGCGNINSGQILCRGRSHLVRRWLQETGKQTDLLYHGWWENAGMIRIWHQDQEIQEAIELRTDYRMINAYLFPKPEYDSWHRGDFCLHFAGVYEQGNIHRFMKYINKCCSDEKDPNMAQLIDWMRNPPALKDVLDKN